MSPERIALTLLTMALLVCGCSSGVPELVVVRGKVSYQGEPVDDGVIRFIPIDRSNSPLRMVAIRQGKYKASGRGAVTAGTYRIVINAYRGGRRDGPPIDPLDRQVDPNVKVIPAEPRVQYLPDRYNKNSELEPLTVPKGSGPITRNFQLE